MSVEKKEIYFVEGLEHKEIDPMLEAAKKVGCIEDDIDLSPLLDEGDGPPTGLYQGTATITDVPTRWARFKHAMGDWWERARVRFCCWVLRIDEFRIEVKADNLRSWKPNFPRNHLVLEDGGIYMESEDDFRHMRGTVTLKDGSNMTVSATVDTEDRFLDGMDQNMWERYGYEAVDDDPIVQAIRRAKARGPDINAPPPATLKGLLRDAFGGIQSGQYSHHDVLVRLQQAINKMGDAWDVGDDIPFKETVGGWTQDMSQAEAEQYVRDHPYDGTTLECMGNLNPAFGSAIITNRRVITMEGTELTIAPIEEPEHFPCLPCGGRYLVDTRHNAGLCDHKDAPPNAFCENLLDEDDPVGECPVDEPKSPTEEPKDNSTSAPPDDKERAPGNGPYIEHVAVMAHDAANPDKSWVDRDEDVKEAWRRSTRALLEVIGHQGKPENPKEPNIIIYGHIHGRIWVDKGVFLKHYGNRNGYKPDDYDGPWPYPPDTGTLTFQAEPPSELTKHFDSLDLGDIGCPQADAMGGTEGPVMEDHPLCYYNQHPDVDADDAMVHFCGKGECPYWEGGDCSYLTIASEGGPR